MNHRKKNIFLVVCILLFLILAPLILSYGLGYRYDYKEKEVVQTGAVVIKTIPAQANIFLNNELQNKSGFWEDLLNDFVKIDQLKVGKYNLKIKKDGYHAWEKNIGIKEGIVTKLANVILLPLDPKIKSAAPGNIDNLWFSRDNRKIAYTVFDNQKNIVLKVSTLNSPHSAAEFKLLASKNSSRINNLKWSEDDKNIIFEVIGSRDGEPNQNPALYLINLEENKIINLNNSFDFLPNSKWQTEDSDIFYLANGDLYRINRAEKSINIFLKNISSRAMEGNTIYYVKSVPGNLESGLPPINSIYKIKNYDILNGNYLIAELPPKEDFDKIEISASGQIILKSKNKKLYLIDDKILELISSSATDFQLSGTQDKLFYFNSHEIWVYYLKEKTSRPAKEKYANDLVARFSGEIKSAAWHSGFEHLFFQTEKTIKFIELDDRGKRNCYDFIELNDSSGAKLVFDEEEDRLYFLETTANKNILKEVSLKEE